jgi:hypothetical protein
MRMARCRSQSFWLKEEQKRENGQKEEKMLDVILLCDG